jgi:hypothetical protein
MDIMPVLVMFLLIGALLIFLDFLLITAYVILSIMWQYTSILMITNRMEIIRDYYMTFSISGLETRFETKIFAS